MIKKYLFFTLFLMASKSYAGAVCTSKVSSLTAQLPNEITITPGSAIPSELTSWISSPKVNTFTCDKADNDSFPDGYNISDQIYLPKTGSTWQGYDIRATSHPSIGVIIRAVGGVDDDDNVPWQLPYAQGQWKPNSYYWGIDDVIISYQIMLIKIGPIEPGVLNSFTVGRTYAHEQNNPASVAYGQHDYVASGTSILSLGTCTPTVTNQSVYMGVVALNELENVGDTAGETQFNIELACTGENNSGINIRFDGTEDADGDGSVIVNNGTAEGVGVQIKYNDSPMQLSNNTRVYNGTVGSMVNASFTASYYRVNRDLTAGTVNSVATYTVTYP